MIWQKMILLIGVFTFFAGSVYADMKDVDDLHTLVTKIYSFSPHKLSKEEIKQKSTELDSFWQLVTSNKDVALAKLREELTRTDNPAFFYYDGSKLLLSLSKDSSDKKLAISAISRSDLQDVQSLDYLITVNKLAREGIDTSLAAFRVLDYPDFKVFVPAHVLTLGQDYSLIFMLCPLPENTFYEQIITRMEKEKNIKARQSLLLLLWYTITDTGDEIIKKIANDHNEPQEVKEYADKLLKTIDQWVNFAETKIDNLKKQHDLNQNLRKIFQTSMKSKSGRDISNEDIENMKILLQSLWSSEIEMNKSIVIGISKDTTAPKELREFAEKLIKGKAVDTDTVLSKKQILPDSIDELKNQRRTVLSSISDESLQEFELLSVLIRWKQAKK